MTGAQIETIGWICVAFLGLTSLVWLLDMISVVNIRSEGQRKLLNRSIGGTFLASILSFVGANVLVGSNGDNPAPPPQPGPSPTASPDSDPTGLLATPTPVPGPTGDSTSGPSEGGSAPPLVDPSIGDGASPGGGIELSAQTNPSCDLAHPEALRTWADGALGVRPNFACATERLYPSCAARLAQRSVNEISEEEADDCAVKVAEFRRSTVSIIYRMKGGYDPALDTVEGVLRTDYSPLGEQRFAYVSSELNRMQGAEWTAFQEVDAKSRADLRACNRIDKCTR